MKANKKCNPYTDALKITLFFGLLGIVWIQVSNKVLFNYATDMVSYATMQYYKDWLYLLVTGLMIYVLAKSRTMRMNSNIDMVCNDYEALNKTHDQLSKEEDSLRKEYKELQDNHDHLATSDQRYKLVIEGSRDGIWDWDIVKNKFYSSIQNKEKFGYKDHEIENNYEAWVSLIHPDDVGEEVDGIASYLESQKGTYENMYRIRCKDGSYRWISSKAKAIWHEEGWPIRVAGSHTDVTTQKEMEDKVYSLAYYNVLTGMPNRSKFEQHVNEKIREYDQTKEGFAIVYMNVDNFRRINDTWGYEVGDEILKHIAQLMNKTTEDFFLCAHLGGDEFAIIMDNIGDRDQVIRKVKNCLQAFNAPWEYKKHKIFITFSMGIVLYPEDGESLYSLVVNADTAMWHVKRHGKDGYCFYTTDMQTKRASYIQTAHQIRKALQNNEFIVFYQPQISLANGQVSGMEALIRWKHPEEGFIFPNDFIPLAEATGEIHAIGRFVLESVCKQKKIWEEKGYPQVVVSVNISGISLTRGDLAEEVEELLETYHVDGSGIRIEITETAIMADVDLAIKTLAKIRQLGVKVALDDFGTGYSSLTYLKRLPLDVVKIDREFIKNIKSQGEKEIIVEVVVQIAEALNLEVVAEGVETQEQLAYVLESKCEQAQGYFFSKPVAPEQIGKILEEGFKYQI